MFSRTKLTAAAAVAVFATVGLTGCAADRSADAARIRVAVTTMPGVGSSDVDYINDFENGANLDISLDMLHATDEQIRATIDGIDDLEGSRFEDHRLTTKINVADAVEVEYGGDGTHLNADQISTDVAAVRRIQARGTSTSLQWKHYNAYSSLELWNSTNPDGDLRAVIAELPESSTRLYVRSIEPEQQSSWDVALPLTLKQMNDAVGIRGRLPVVVYQVDMRDGRIAELSVNLGEPAAAASHAVAVVSAVAPDKAHPFVLEWRLNGAGPGEIDRFTACSPIDDRAAAAPANPSFASLKDWATKAFVGCGP